MKRFANPAKSKPHPAGFYRICTNAFCPIKKAWFFWPAAKGHIMQGL
jgi:hypothetical protein